MTYWTQRNPSRNGRPTTEEPFRLGFCTYQPSDFADVAAIGARYIRTDNPDAIKVGQIRAVGCEVIPIARYALGDLPSNASVGQVDAWAAGKLALWSGLAVPPPVIEFVNEPWNAGFSDFTTNYPLYMALMRSFCRQAWNIWPSMRILVCADTGPIAGWLDAVLAADTSKLHADSRIRPSVHAYVEARTPEEATGGDVYRFERYRASYDRLRAFGHQDPRVWVTEFGWESITAGSTYVTAPVSEALMSDYTIRGLELMRKSGVVETACVFCMAQGTTTGYNVKRPDGHPSGSASAKPVVAALTSYAYGKV